MSTYVLSDLHSHLHHLEAFRQELEPGDEVFCLGDCIDKGPDGIEVLREVLNDERFTYIIGNHEFMMLQYLEARQQGVFASFEKGILWLRYNYGQPTFDDFRKLSVTDREILVRKLYDSYLMKNVEVNGRKFVLVHAYPHDYNGEDVLYYQKSDEERQQYVWERHLFYHLEERTIITGHNIAYMIEPAEPCEVVTDGQWYDIDCGLAANAPWSRLAVLKLDDMSVKYYD